MTIEKTLAKLRTRANTARNEVDEVRNALASLEAKICDITRFESDTVNHGNINTVNDYSDTPSCAILTQLYDIDGREFLFAITETTDCDSDVSFVGNIIDFSNKTVLYACQFYYGSYKEKQELFDHLLVNYVEWRFDL